MTNRITNQPVENMPTAPDGQLPERPPLVEAHRVWHWRCPDCGTGQLAKKSATHDAQCWKCEKRFTVEIRS